MTKTEVVELISSLKIPYNEGTPNDKVIEDPEIIYFWDYLWDGLTASGKEYNTKCYVSNIFLSRNT